VAASLDGRLFVVGGLDAASVRRGTVYVYAPATNVWSSGPTMSTVGLTTIETYSVDLRPLEPRRAVLSCPSCQGPLRLEEIEGSVHLMHVCDAHGTFFERHALDTYNDLWSEKRTGDVSEDELESLGVSRKGFFGFFKR
jgi:hypothetical protein